MTNGPNRDQKIEPQSSIVPTGSDDAVTESDIDKVVSPISRGYPLKFIPSVAHVGTMNAADRQPSEIRMSYEGGCLSVSLHPEEWKEIAKLGNASFWTLSRPDAVYLDITEMEDAAVNDAIVYASSVGLVEGVEGWRTWLTDDNDEWYYTLSETREEAIEEFNFKTEEALKAGMSYDMPEHLDNSDNTEAMPIEMVPVWVLTEAGGQRAGTNHKYLIDASDNAVIFWAEDILRQRLPNLVGVWWDETMDVLAMSAPRGGIFPSVINSSLISVDFGWTGQEHGVPPTTMIDISDSSAVSDVSEPDTLALKKSDTEKYRLPAIGFGIDGRLGQDIIPPS